MLMEMDKCEVCGKLFTFDTCQCSQVIIKQGEPDSVIVFLPKCPHCQGINSAELPWDKYNIIDY